MATENAKIDGNRHKAMLAEKDDGSGELQNLRVDPTTKRLKVSAVITSPFTSLSDTPSSYTGQGTKVVSVNASETALEFTAAGGGAPTSAEYWVSQADGALSNEVNLGVLTTGLIKHTVAAGVSTPATATEGTDYYGPAGTDVAVTDGGTGASDAGTARTNLDAQEDISGATLTAVTVATDDKVLIQDTNDTDNLKTVTAQSIADLAAGGSSAYDATVGSSGADYTDIQAAITGVGGTDIKLLLITDVTEDSDIAVPNGAKLYLDLSSYTLTLGINQFTNSAATCYIYIRGNGVDSGAEIDYTATGIGEEMFTLFDDASVIDVEGFVWDNNSSNTDCFFNDKGIIRVRNVRAELPNQSSSGFFNSVEGSYVEDSYIVGGGSSCTRPISSVETVSNIRFTGEFATNSLMYFSGSNVDGLFFDVTGTVSINGFTNLSNVCKGAGTLNISANIVDCNLSNVCAADSIDIQAIDVCNLVNIETVALVLSGGGATSGKFTNVRVTSAATVAGDGHKFTNCDFIGGASVSSGADNNGFVNCQFGPDAGGGALTLTVDAGSNNTRIVGCMTDAAISDAGTGTTTAANIVY